MPIDSALVGSEHQRPSPRGGRPLDHGLQRGSRRHRTACYLDTAGEVVAHPLFTIAPEWNVHLEGRDMFAANGLAPDERLTQRPRHPRLSRPSARPARRPARHARDHGARGRAAPRCLRGDPARHDRCRAAIPCARRTRRACTGGSRSKGGDCVHSEPPLACPSQGRTSNGAPATPIAGLADFRFRPTLPTSTASAPASGTPSIPT